MKKHLLIIWDWDNTLNDTSSSIFKALQDTMKHYGLPEPTQQDLNEVMGHHKGAYWERVFPGYVDEAFDYMIHQFARYHLESNLFPETKEILSFVYQLNIPQLIISNKPQDLLDMEVDKSGVRDLVKGVIGTDYILPDKKPMPTFGSQAIKHIPHQDLLVIGDGAADIEYAQAIGAKSVYIKKAEQVESDLNPDYRFDNLTDVSHWLKTYLKE